MADTLIIPPGLTSREEKYRILLPQVKALVEGEPDLVANLANIAAALREVFGFLWIGFYFVKNDQLVLGPFQGPVACTRIGFGKGVCGTAWKEKRPIRVDDVDSFPGHIACNSLSKSEIVIPALRSNGEVFLILDIDSDQPAAFNEIDEAHLLELIRVIESF